jgi:type III restriction enzyme
MKLQFDPNQSFQLDAVASVTDLFEGQPQGAPEYAVIKVGDMGGLFAGQSRVSGGRSDFPDTTTGVVPLALINGA